MQRKHPPAYQQKLDKLATKRLPLGYRVQFRYMAVIKVLVDDDTDKKIREKAKRYGFASVQQFLLFMAQNGQAVVK